MAVFGSLKDVPLPEILSLLGKRGGLLEVFALPGQRQSYIIALERGRVLWVKRGIRFLDPLQARSSLYRLLHIKQGAFEFYPGVPPPPPEDYRLGWALEYFFLVVSTIEDEIRSYKSFFPASQTRFEAVTLDALLDEPLWTFWKKASPFLVKPGGVSAEELAQVLGLKEQEVAYYLYKLQATGKVRLSSSQGGDSQKRTQKAQGWLQRLLGL